MTQRREGRLSGSTEAAPESVVATHPQHTGGTRVPHLSRAEILAALPAYVLILKTPGAHISRRVYLTLAAADQAAQRSRDRGHAASLELVRLTSAAALTVPEDGGKR